MQTLADILQRIEKRLDTLGLSSDAASNMAGKKDAIRNMKRAVKEGRDGVSTATIQALAPVLETSVSWLMEGGDVPEMSSEDVASLLDGPEKRTVKIKGYVGAGSETHYYRFADEDFESVDPPAGASDRTIAVEIKGKSWGPQMDGWLVFYDDVRSPVTPDMYNLPCVVGLADDRILLKTIKPSRDGLFTLLSNSNEPPIEDVEIEWAAKVIGMRPR